MLYLYHARTRGKRTLVAVTLVAIFVLLNFAGAEESESAISGNEQRVKETASSGPYNGGSMLGGAHPHFFGDGHNHEASSSGSVSGGNSGDIHAGDGGWGFIPDHDGETAEEHAALLAASHLNDMHHLEVARDIHESLHGQHGGGEGNMPHSHDDEL